MLRLLKTFLYRIIHSPPKFKGELDGFHKLYEKTEDPWNFQASKYEDERFKVMLDYVKKARPKKVLELGCAEGIFTSMLPGHCEKITAVELSPKALEKAREKTLQATYIQGDFTEKTVELAKENFDLIIASELLYYLKEKDVKEFFEKTRPKHILTSNYWSLQSKVSDWIRQVGYTPVNSKWIYALEDFQIKAAKIVLYKSTSPRHGLHGGQDTS